MTHQQVSVIIPTLNGGARFQQLLAGLQSQSLAPLEILVIDSGSDDGTLQSARSAGADVSSIARSDFDHGATRTMAARKARGDVLVYLTQDAVPANDNALGQLVSSLEEENVAAAYGRQIPDADATVFARHLRHFNYPDRSGIRCFADREKYGFKTAFISNSFAAYSRPLLAEVGYFASGMLFGEDSFTVAKLLIRGYCVAYNADAVVEHSHNYTIVQEFRRYFDIGVFHAQHGELLGKFGSPLGEGKRYVRAECSFLREAGEGTKIIQGLFRNGMKFAAYHLGKHHATLPRAVCASLSFNRGWWNKVK